MSRFTAPLIVSPRNDGRTWVIIHSTEDEEQFAYEVGSEGSGIMARPPALFETDFASVPRLLWWLFPRWGRYGNAAVIHDYLYRGGHFFSVLNEEAEPSYPDRIYADTIFLEGMVVLGVRKWQRLLIYWGVRLGGWYAWKQNRA